MHPRTLAILNDYILATARRLQAIDTKGHDSIEATNARTETLIVRIRANTSTEVSIEDWTAFQAIVEKVEAGVDYEVSEVKAKAKRANIDRWVNNGGFNTLGDLLND